jgi:hypothetical protein
VTTWNGRGQGVQSLAIWRANQDARDMINFCATFMFPFRMRFRTDDINDWVNPATGSDIDLVRYHWETQRFFGLNRSKRYSNFDSRSVVDMDQEGSFANVFERDGRVLAVIGYLGTGGEGKVGPVRREHLKIISPETLGLKGGVGYRIMDIAHNRYLSGKTYSMDDLKSLPVTLTFGEPTILHIEPAAKAPRVVYFRGVDDLTAEVSGGKMTVKTDAVPGSPLILHLDTGGHDFRPLTAGFVKKAVKGQFPVFSGVVPENGTVELGMR